MTRQLQGFLKKQQESILGKNYHIQGCKANKIEVRPQVRLSPNTYRNDQCQGDNGALTTRQLLQALMPGVPVPGISEHHPVLDGGPCCCNCDILQGHITSGQHICSSDSGLADV